MVSSCTHPSVLVNELSACHDVRMAEYFDDAKKIKWRAKHPNLPDPQVWCRDATDEDAESCASARRTLALVRKRGWTATMTYARGCQGNDEGFPEYHTRDEPLYNEDGSKVLTETGKHSVMKVPTDQLVIVESLVVRATRNPGEWLRVVWERTPSNPKSRWKFWKAFAHQRIMKSAEFKNFLEN